MVSGSLSTVRRSLTKTGVIEWNRSPLEEVGLALPVRYRFDRALWDMTLLDL